MTTTRKPVVVEFEGMTIPLGDVESDETESPDARGDNVHYACTAWRKARGVLIVKTPIGEDGKRQEPVPLWDPEQHEAAVLHAITAAQGQGVTPADVQRAMESAAELRGELRVLRDAVGTIHNLLNDGETPKDFAMAMARMVSEAARACMVVGMVDTKLVKGEAPRAWFTAPPPAASTLRLVTG